MRKRANKSICNSSCPDIYILPISLAPISCLFRIVNCEVHVVVHENILGVANYIYKGDTIKVRLPIVITIKNAIIL